MSKSKSKTGDFIGFQKWRSHRTRLRLIGQLSKHTGTERVDRKNLREWINLKREETKRDWETIESDYVTNLEYNEKVRSVELEKRLKKLHIPDDDDEDRPLHWRSEADREEARNKEVFVEEDENEDSGTTCQVCGKVALWSRWVCRVCGCRFHKLCLESLTYYEKGEVKSLEKLVRSPIGWACYDCVS